MGVPYATLLAEFAEFGERARIFAAAKYGSEAQLLDAEMNGQNARFLNIYVQGPMWNEPQGGGAPGVVIDPVSDH